MYNYSGEFAFSMGFPAKSSGSGLVLIVIPGVMGICTFSPRLDGNGNSVRGLAFCHALTAKYAFHNYDALTAYVYLAGGAGGAGGGGVRGGRPSSCAAAFRSSAPAADFSRARSPADPCTRLAAGTPCDHPQTF